jgi:hypothetical protein
MMDEMMNVVLTPKFALLALAGALLVIPAVKAQSLVFNVDLNTAGLSTNTANAPFYLDVAMSYGNSSLTTSSATINNFLFTGGNPTGSSFTTGTASGDFASSVSLTASNATGGAELYQQFSPGVTDIHFQVTVNEPGPNPQGTPSEFTVSLMDSSLGSPAQIFTSAPDQLNLVTLNLNASNTTSNVNYYSGTSSADGLTPLSVSAGPESLSAVPEPSSTAAIMGGVSMLFAAGVRRFKKKPAVA